MELKQTRCVRQRGRPPPAAHIHLGKSGPAEPTPYLWDLGLHKAEPVRGGPRG